MGAAPSREILRGAPFRPTRNSSGRVLSLIPITPEFFPSADDPLFQQLYEARSDAYVRYYMRDYDKNGDECTDDIDIDINNDTDIDNDTDTDNYSGEGGGSSDVQLDSIPLAPFNREEYYKYWISLVQQCQQYETNKYLCNVYNTAPNKAHGVIRPIPCAVAFQYDDSSSAPEGCVPLGDTYVRVIGAIGCLLPTRHKKKKNSIHININNDNNNNIHNSKKEETPLKMLLFLRKSAGDHNMVRVTLFAAWLFHNHCVRLCKMAHTPLPAITFCGLKTNIPLLCFLREMRSRIDLLQGNRDDHRVWLDGVFLRVHITDKHACELCEALAKHYDSLLESKPRVSEGKPLPLSLVNNNNNDNISNSSSSDNNSSNDLSDMEDSNTLLRTPHSYRSVKQSFDLAGYIDRHHIEIPAMGSSRDEVYLVCIDTTVTVRCSRRNGEVEVMKSKYVNNNNDNDNNKNNNENNDTSDTFEALTVTRGDILRFEPDESDEFDNFDAFIAQPPHCGEGEIPYSCDHHHNSNDNTPTHSVDITIDTPGITPTNSSCSRIINNSNSKNREVARRVGPWKVDESVHVENVLLAVVHDECKNAREATADDPHWVINKKTGEPLCDNNFYIWRFERKGIHYYYGTVPKFANSFKKRSDTNRKQRGAVNSTSATTVSTSTNEMKQSLSTFVLQENGIGIQTTPKRTVSHLIPVTDDPTAASHPSPFPVQPVNPIQDISTNNQCVNQPTGYIYCKGAELLYPLHSSRSESATSLSIMPSNTSLSVSLGAVPNTTSTENSLVCEQNSVSGTAVAVSASAVNYPMFQAFLPPQIPWVQLTHPLTEVQYVSPITCLAYVPPSQPLPMLQPLHSVQQQQQQQQQQQTILHQTPTHLGCFVNSLLAHPPVQPPQSGSFFSDRS
ncbi:hypothetical protein LSM04_005941 [Trypanosoma melophagium]|uniref:uncharacterized protein n=1 Tax=Trypanosoma melophagium TaxID=715481 RepID=UPI00351A492E|nr:hypothetical protein LSM04_005941 [Trypanosoma melophagium]